MENKEINNDLFKSFTNKYPLNKVLRFELQETKNTKIVDLKNVIKDDKNRASRFIKIKELIKDYDRSIIKDKLNNFNLSETQETEIDSQTLRKKISNQLGGSSGLFPKLKKWDKQANNNENSELIEEFEKFSGYLNELNINRENLYSANAIKTAIAYRIVDENLPIYKDNINKYSNLPDDLKTEKWNNVKTIHYNRFLTQEGIEKYNLAIGELNASINKWWQKSDKKVKLEDLLMKALYKQILSIRDESKLQYNFNTDKELLSKVKDFYDEFKKSYSEELKTIFTQLNENNYSLENLFIHKKHLSRISLFLYDDWKVLGIDKKEKVEGFVSFKELDDKIASIKDKNSFCSLIEFFNKFEYRGFDKTKKAPIYKNIWSEIDTAFEEIDYWNQNYPNLLTSSKRKKQIQTLLDNLLYLFQHIQIIVPNKNNLLENTLEKDENFYTSIKAIYDYLKNIIIIRLGCQSYLTKNKGQQNRLKLVFDAKEFLGGWSISAETSKLGIILRKENQYFLGVFNKGNMKPYFDGVDIKHEASSNSKSSSDYYYEKLNYVQNSKEPDFEKYINSKTNLTLEKNENPEVIGESPKKYQIRFDKINAGIIDNLTQEKKLFLFKIYSKDFSSKSKGKDNLHTIYWKALFDFTHNKDAIIKLNGGAEIFYRPKMLDNTVIHKEGEWIAKKYDLDGNKLTPEQRNEAEKNKNTTFAKKLRYDIVKDKRFTTPKLQFHVPLTFNFGKEENNEENLNSNVIEQIKTHENINLMGIDLGERNLIYICIIDKDGKLIYQKSLNTINNIDYHALLTKKEEERKNDRKNWAKINDIKNTKEGYLSLAIYEIIKLMFEYNSLIILEDLSQNFKRSRMIYERQVYQKFQKSLIDKLNYLVFKEKESGENGSVFKAYQLTNKYLENNINKQNGVLFFVNPSYTSKICPKSGFFVDTNNDVLKDISAIKYNTEKDYFEFAYKNWTVCSIGKDRLHYNDESKKIETIKDATQSMKSLFSSYKIDFANSPNLLNDIREITEENFVKEFKKLLKAIFQLRHSNKDTGEDFILSPVAPFFDSRNSGDNDPKDSDANGAYNISRKGKILLGKINANISNLEITNQEWYKFAQEKSYEK